MNKYWLGFLALCCADAAVAQDPGFSFSVGVRAWYTDWTTFSYYVDDTTDPDTNLALTQKSASNEVVLIPLVSVRYRDFVGSVSGWPSTKFSFDDGSSGTREEFDINVGYYVMSGVAFTLGYKKVQQSEGPDRYPAGRPGDRRQRQRAAAGRVVLVRQPGRRLAENAWRRRDQLRSGLPPCRAGPGIHAERRSAAAELDLHGGLPHPGPDFEGSIRNAGRPRHDARLQSRRHGHVLMSIRTLAARWLRPGSRRSRNCR